MKFHLPPKNQSDLVRQALIRCHESGTNDHTQRARAWALTWNYMQGYRELAPGISQGSLPAASFTDGNKRKRIRVEKILTHYRIEMGRLLSVDLKPVVERSPGLSLDTIRQEAIAQGFLEEFIRMPIDRGLAGIRACHLTLFGNIGYGVFPGGNPEQPWKPRIQMIPIWELRPVPSKVNSRTDLCGIEWTTWVPYKDLKAQYDGRLRFPRKDKEGDLKMRSVNVGSRVEVDQAPAQDEGGAALGSSSDDGSTNPYRTDKKSATVDYVNLQQWYIHDEEGVLTRYIVMLGEWLAADEDFSRPETLEALGGIRPLMPIHVEDHTPMASFYGRGVVDQLIPLNRELENVLGQLIRVSRNAERMRRVWIPAAAGNNRRETTSGNDDSPISYYSPDIQGPTLYPRVTEPGNAGESWGRLLNTLVSIMDDMAAQGPLFSGEMPGRTDSASGANVVLEAQNVPMAPSGESTLRCWTGIYRAALSLIRVYFARNPEASKDILVHLGRLDQRLIGVKLNPQDGSLVLDPALIPDPRNLRLSIRSVLPRDKAAIKLELDSQRDRGLLPDPLYWVKVVQEGLDIPIPSMTPWNNYEKAWLENHILFGDGKTPGRVEHIDIAEDHTIHLLAHMELVSSQAFLAADPSVQQKVMNHIQVYHQPMVANVTDRQLALDNFGTAQAMSQQLMAQAGQMPPGPQGAGY